MINNGKLKSKDKEEGLISVIIPVYNAEAYLERCITSICEQTYKKMEIIVIDDGSTDNTWEIIRDLSEKDCRIKSYRKKNSGSADTRNYGIRIATGEYIGFVDSDDWISSVMYEKMYNSIIENDADMAVCQTMDCNENGDEKVRCAYKKEVLNNEEAVEKILLTQCSVWNKLYRAEIIKNVEFLNMKRAEDGPFMFKVLAQDLRVIFLDEPLYFCFYRKGSLSHTVFSKKTWCVWEAGVYLYDEILKYNSELKNLASFRYFLHYNILLNEIAKSPNVKEILDGNSSKIKVIRKKSKQVLKQVFFNPYLSGTAKIVSIIETISPRLYIWWRMVRSNMR